jgi:hypothetical protein
VTRGEGVLLLAVAGFAALLLFGVLGVEVHRLLAELARELQTVAGPS